MRKLYVWGALLWCLMTLPFRATADTANYVVLGDSIATGYGLTDTHHSYAAIVADTLHLSLHNHAENGATSAELLSLLQQDDGKLREQIGGAALISVSIGGNDIISEKALFLAQIARTALTDNGVPMGKIETIIKLINPQVDFSALQEEIDLVFDRFERQYTDIIRLLREWNPQAPIYVQTLYNPYLANEMTVFGIRAGEAINGYIDRINAVYRRVLAGDPDAFVLIDTAAALNADEQNFYASGDFHPTKAGHAVIAKAILDTWNTSVGSGTTSDKAPDTTSPTLSVVLTPTPPEAVGQTNGAASRSVVPAVATVSLIGIFVFFVLRHARQ